MTDHRDITADVRSALGGRRLPRPRPAGEVRTGGTCPRDPFVADRGQLARVIRGSVTSYSDGSHGLTGGAFAVAMICASLVLLALAVAGAR